jgi:hypothetical protein
MPFAKMLRRVLGCFPELQEGWSRGRKFLHVIVGINFDGSIRTANVIGEIEPGRILSGHREPPASGQIRGAVAWVKAVVPPQETGRDAVFCEYLLP